MPDHSVIGSPAPSTPAGTVPSRMPGATRASASRSGARRVSVVVALPQARPRSERERRRRRRAGRRSTRAAHPAPPGLSRASCQGSGVVPPHWASPAPATSTGQEAVGLAHEPRGQHGDGHERDDQGVHPHPAADDGEHEGEHDDQREQHRGERTEHHRGERGGERARGGRAPGGEQPEAARRAAAAGRGRRARPSRPWATEADATPVVAHANAARPRTQRVVTTGRRER